MANRRRNQAGAVRLDLILKVIVIIGLIASSCVGYVLQKNKIFELGQRISTNEIRLARLRWENKIKAIQLANLLLPRNLEQRGLLMHLGLLQPHPGQIIWLPEPQPETNAVPPPTPPVVAVRPPGRADRPTAMR